MTHSYFIPRSRNTISLLPQHRIPVPATQLYFNSIPALLILSFSRYPCSVYFYFCCSLLILVFYDISCSFKFYSFIIAFYVLCHLILLFHLVPFDKILLIGFEQLPALIFLVVFSRDVTFIIFCLPPILPKNNDNIFPPRSFYEVINAQVRKNETFLRCVVSTQESETPVLCSGKGG